MAKQLEIEINDFRLVLNRILDHIENDLKIKKISLEKDMYWEIPSKQLFELETAPVGLTVGQLYDDWEFLQKIVEDKDRAVSLMLIHAAPLLRYIGEKIGQ